MDPEATLNIADQAISDLRFADARRALRDYQTWRKRDGFEPWMRVAERAGDAFAAYCERRLLDAMRG